MIPGGRDWTAIASPLPPPPEISMSAPGTGAQVNTCFV